MFISSLFRKSIFISLLGHLAVFSIFSFSFGQKLPKLDYAGINFRGSVLSAADLNYPFQAKARPMIHKVIDRGSAMNQADTFLPEKITYLKPEANPSFLGDKIIFSDTVPLLPPQGRNKPAIMLYPHLPRYFNIFFRDRQLVHLELMFNITSDNSANSITVKRRVSSGNLEVDLLCARYINHYLFIQRAAFMPNHWQSVSIDFSTKSD